MKIITGGKSKPPMQEGFYWVVPEPDINHEKEMTIAELVYHENGDPCWWLVGDGEYWKQPENIMVCEFISPPRYYTLAAITENKK